MFLDGLSHTLCDSHLLQHIEQGGTGNLLTFHVYIKAMAAQQVSVSTRYAIVWPHRHNCETEADVNASIIVIVCHYTFSPSSHWYDKLKNYTF